jgi:WD40 repeat protein
MVAWTDAPPEERARGTLQYHWSCWGSWKPSDWMLGFAVVSGGVVVGTQGIGGRDFGVLREVHTGSWLGLGYQGQGIGTQMRTAVLHLAFEGLGARHAVSAAFEDNAASLSVSRKLGYRDDGIEWHQVRDRPVLTRRLRLTRADWEAAQTAVASGGILAAVDASNHIYLWNSATGKRIKTLTAPQGQGFLSIAFGPGDTLAAGAANGNIYRWNVTTGKPAGTLAFPGSAQVPGGIPVASLAFGPGGTLAALDPDNGICLWSAATGWQTVNFADSGASVESIGFEAHDALATADQGGTVDLWNAATGNRTASLPLPVNSLIVSAAFGPDGIVATADGSGTVDLWNATGTLVGTLAGPAGHGVQSVAFGPSGTVLAAVGSNGDLYLWHIIRHTP